MAGHARTGVRRAVVGSIAGAVMRKSSTPVLLVHRDGPGTIDGGDRPSTLVQQCSHLSRGRQQ